MLNDGKLKTDWRSKRLPVELKEGRDDRPGHDGAWLSWRIDQEIARCNEIAFHQVNETADGHGKAGEDQRFGGRGGLEEPGGEKTWAAVI